MILAEHSPALNAIICTGVCAWLLPCDDPPEKGTEFCLRHNKISGQPVEPKPKKAIKIKSIKRVAEDRLLKKMFNARFEINQECELKIPGVCTGIAEVFDHVQKTSPKNRLEALNLKMSCSACNMAKEGAEGQQYAKDNGLHVSRFAKIITVTLLVFLISCKAQKKQIIPTYKKTIIDTLAAIDTSIRFLGSGWSSAMSVGPLKNVTQDSVWEDTWYWSDYTRVPASGLFVDTVIYNNAESNTNVIQVRVFMSRKIVMNFMFVRPYDWKTYVWDADIDKKYFTK